MINMFLLQAVSSVTAMDVLANLLKSINNLFRISSFLKNNFILFIFSIISVMLTILGPTIDINFLLIIIFNCAFGESLSNAELFIIVFLFNFFQLLFLLIKILPKMWVVLILKELFENKLVLIRVNIISTVNDFFILYNSFLTLKI